MYGRMRPHGAYRGLPWSLVCTPGAIQAHHEALEAHP
jgi:hypothetical protein